MEPAQPWENEPDKLEFEHAGYRCLILRTPELRHLCGYVSVPEGHPAFGKGDSDLDVEVHGGVTFSSTDVGGHDAEGWWIGFDCAHFGDHCPGMRTRTGENDQYRTIHYVKAETMSLADQLRKMA